MRIINMNKIKKIAAIFITSLVTISSAYCCNDEKESTPKNSVQDTAKAALYFDDELNFTINPYGVNDAIKNKKDVVIVDIRSESKYLEGHIPGAINLPIDKYNSFAGDEKEYPGLRKDTFNYVYCYELLCGGGKKACRKLANLGYPVKLVIGGFKAWQDSNYPIEK